METHKDREANEWIDGWVDRQRDGWTNRRTDGRTNTEMDKCMDEWA